MPTKTNIIDNIEQYSAHELYRYIKDGIVGFEELCEETAGYFPADVRKELEGILAGGNESREPAGGAYPTPPPFVPPGTPDSSADEEWNAVDKTDPDALRAFVETHPGHPMNREANRLRNEIFMASHVAHDIETLKSDVNNIMTNKMVLDKGTKIFNTISEYITNGWVTTEEFLSLLAQDNNFVSAYVVKELLKACYFTYDDLTAIGIDRRFIDFLIQENDEQPLFMVPRRIDQVGKVSTEIYFWGIPSSGKTCALGGILSVANGGTVARNMSFDNDCQGYGYMTRLANVFRENGTVATLPPGTGIFDIWEMGFDLEDEDGRVHPVTCIDLAGELVRCMYKYDAGETLTEDELSTLQTVTNLLVSNKSTNRKIHFFVLEYGGEERQYEGLNQSTYLKATLEYIKRTQIFDKDTDAIFLLFTKVDKVPYRGEALVNHLVEYTDCHYAGFYNGLVALCKDKEINRGKVERMAFTLGTVCFQNYCLFDGRAASNVVRQIINRSKGFKKGKLQNIINKFKK